MLSQSTIDNIDLTLHVCRTGLTILLRQATGHGFNEYSIYRNRTMRWTDHNIHGVANAVDLVQALYEQGFWSGYFFLINHGLRVDKNDLSTMIYLTQPLQSFHCHLQNVQKCPSNPYTGNWITRHPKLGIIDCTSSRLKLVLVKQAVQSMKCWYHVNYCVVSY